MVRITRPIDEILKLYKERTEVRNFCIFEKAETFAKFSHVLKESARQTCEIFAYLNAQAEARNFRMFLRQTEVRNFRMFLRKIEGQNFACFY